MSSIEIENQIADAEKDLKTMIEAHSTVEQERLNMQFNILTIQTAKKKLEISLDKSRTALRSQDLLIKELTRQFWAAKNSGG